MAIGKYMWYCITYVKSNKEDFKRNKIDEERMRRQNKSNLQLYNYFIMILPKLYFYHIVILQFFFFFWCVFFFLYSIWFCWNSHHLVNKVDRFFGLLFFIGWMGNVTSNPTFQVQQADLMHPMNQTRIYCAA